MDYLILLGIAIFIFYKLYSVLGNIDEDSDRERINKKIHQIQDAIEEYEEKQEEYAHIQIASGFEASLPQEIREVFDKARNISKTIDAKKFLDGSKKAYEIIIKAFANGDAKTLKLLLSESVFKLFNNAISKRNEQNTKYECTLVGISNAEIVSAELNANILSIKVMFESEQIQVTTDNLGNIISGNNQNIVNVKEYWTFSKHLKTNTNVWTLIETSTV